MRTDSGQRERERHQVTAGTVHRSVSIKSLKWQLALKWIPGWSRVGSHVELMTPLRPRLPKRCSSGRGAEGRHQIKEVFVPVMFL